MRVLVVGAGATGGYFGARLAQAGRDVTFLVRSGRADQLRADGLVIHSPHGDLRLVPRLMTRADLSETFDLILLAVKAYALEQVVKEIRPAVASSSVVLPLLNGLRQVDLLADHFGGQRVLGGVCLVTTDLNPDGSISQLNERQEIRYGVLQPPGPERLSDIEVQLQQAGFTVGRSADIRLEMWEKWVLVAALGAMTCLMRGVVRDVVAVPGGRELAERLVAECAAVAAACDQPLTTGALAQILHTLTEPDSPAASSLYRDLCRGRPVEADHLLGDLIDRAGESGLTVPLLCLAYLHLKVYQRRSAI